MLGNKYDAEDLREEAIQCLQRQYPTDISEWDQKFIAVDQEMLFEIILAANYLDIKPLLYVPSLRVTHFHARVA